MRTSIPQGGVGIFGAAGAVGSAAAFALALGGTVGRLVLVDAAEDLLEAQRLDLEALGAGRPGLVVETGPADALAGCDVVVACASVRHRDGAPRMAFLGENAGIVALLADALGAVPGRCGAVVLVTNPVDVLATLLQRRLGADGPSVIGYALNDTLRLRVAIARRLGCSAAEVEAWSVGEHGPHGVPLLSRVRVAGAAVTLSASARAAVLEEVGGWYDRWQRLGTGRTATWSTGWGVAAIVRALLGGGDERPWPVSTMLHGQYGVDGVCLTVPVVLGRDGGARVLEWSVDPAEAEAIATAAEVVATATAARGVVSR